MSTPAKAGALLPLVTKLKTCPARDSSLSRKLLAESWQGFKETDLEHGDEITPAVMAGLILFDEEQYAQLLDGAERAQLAALAKPALERFHEKTSPPNKLGKTIAAAIKEKESI
jgi:hypothetical protein